MSTLSLTMLVLLGQEVLDRGQHEVIASLPFQWEVQDDLGVGVDGVEVP